MIAYDDELRALVQRHLADHPTRSHPLLDRRAAAVAVVLVDSEPDADAPDPAELPEDFHDTVPGDTVGFDGSVSGVAGGAAFLLCRRAARLNRHAAQWALPGGRLDPGETPEDAARRELHEELGLDLPASAVLGRLDDYPTRSGYVITPVVLWAGGTVELVPHPGEVAHAYRIGLHELCRADSPRFVSIPESPRPVVQIPIGSDLIHAPTGAVLLQLRLVGLDGQVGARVDELEQPVFAWG